MVIVFATVVFTGSVIKGARDRVGGLFGKARSIKSEQESRRNKSVTSAEPNDTTKTPSCRQTLPYHISNTPNNSTTTKARCFQSYSSDDFFNCPEENLTVKAQGHAEKQVQEPKKDTGATTASETVETDHAMTETSRIRDGQSGLGMREDQEKIEMNIKSDEKPKRVSFQTSPSQKGQIRHRREPPKTLKKELEEEGMLIDEAGEARIATKPCKQLEERSSQDQSSEVSTEEQIDNLKQIRIIEEQGKTSSHNQCDEVKTEVQLYNLKEDEANETDPAVSEITSAVPDPGNLHSSQDDSSITKDGQNSIKLHDAEESKDAIECCTDEKVVPTEDTTVFKPAMMDQNLKEDKSLLSKQHNTGEAKEHGRKNIHHASKEEKDTSCNNNSNDIYNTDSDKVKIPQEDVEHACSHVSRPPNESHLSESKQVDAPSINAGYTAQNQSENEIQQTKDIISENENYKKSAVIKHKEVFVRNVRLGDTSGVKHRSQKAMEGSPFSHLDTHQENNATRRENAKVGVGTTQISEGNSQESKGSSEDQSQPSTVQQIPTVTTDSDEKEAVVNYSPAQTCFEHSRDLHTLNILLPRLALTVSLPDECDHVFERCRSGDGRLGTTQDCVELSAEPISQYDKEMPSDKSDDNEPIEQSPCVSDKYLDYCYSTEPFFCSRKKDNEEVSHRMRSCSDASNPSQESNVKNILHRFLEDFGAVDCVGAYWRPDNPLAKNSDIIVMASEKRDQKGKRMENCELQERIIKVTEKLTAITREIKRQEDRLLKLEKEVRAARSESEKSEQELQKEQSLYRESLLRCCKVKEDAMTLESRCRAVELELRTMKQRRERTNYMLKSARDEVRLLDHQIAKEQTLQEEQRDKRLGDKRRRFRWTSLKINTLAALIVLQIILIIIIALWRL